MSSCSLLLKEPSGACGEGRPDRVSRDPSLQESRWPHARLVPWWGRWVGKRSILGAEAVGLSHWLYLNMEGKESSQDDTHISGRSQCLDERAIH